MSGVSIVKSETKPASANESETSNAPAEPTLIYEEEICRKNIWGTCLKLPLYCRFKHIRTIDVMRKTIKFCHDFQNQGCSRANCSYLHATREEEEVFLLTKQIPKVLLDRYSVMEGASEMEIINENVIVIPRTAAVTTASSVPQPVPPVTSNPRSFQPPQHAVQSTSQAVQPYLAVQPSPGMLHRPVPLAPQTGQPHFPVPPAGQHHLPSTAVGGYTQTRFPLNGTTQTPYQPSSTHSIIDVSRPPPSLVHMSNNIDVSRPPPSLVHMSNRDVVDLGASASQTSASLFNKQTSQDNNFAIPPKRMCLGTDQDEDAKDAEVNLCTECVKKKLSLDEIVKAIETKIKEIEDTELLIVKRTEWCDTAEKMLRSIRNAEYRNIIDELII